ncbi:LysR family transcriptional regulator [Lysobacter korlensis]|uniref:LysR family transcriptional regulator n=1 Tax=Lysobacter korlensis TaxID=553636 RepID=A0ABV6RX45_9GAMM
MQLRNFDLNLLLPLRALLEEKSVTRAAERMHMSQPALSAALARLRRHFNDELLERRGNSFQLTPLAQQLLDLTYAATAGVERVFTAQAEFDPATSTREFSIYGSDYVTAVLGPSLLDVLSEAAPNVRLRFRPMTGAVVADAPDSVRDDDGVLMPHGFLTGLEHLDLFVDRWVCMVDGDNSEVGDTIVLEQLAAMPWISTYSGISEYTPPMKQLQLLGVEPQVKLVSNSFTVLPYLLADSNRVAFVQEALGKQLTTHSAGMRIIDVPFDVVPLTEALWWHPVHTLERDHVWFRSMLRKAVLRAGLTPAPPRRPS